MTEITTDNGNGRVTMALLGAKLDVLIQQQAEIKAVLTEQGREINTLKNGAGVREARLAQVEKCQDEHDHAIEDLKSSRNQWGITNSVLAAIAGIVGWFR